MKAMKRWSQHSGKMPLPPPTLHDPEPALQLFLDPAPSPALSRFTTPTPTPSVSPSVPAKRLSNGDPAKWMLWLTAQSNALKSRQGESSSSAAASSPSTLSPPLSAVSSSVPGSASATSDATATTHLHSIKYDLYHYLHPDVTLSTTVVYPAASSSHSHSHSPPSPSSAPSMPASPLPTPSSVPGALPPPPPPHASTAAAPPDPSSQQPPKPEHTKVYADGDSPAPPSAHDANVARFLRPSSQRSRSDPLASPIPTSPTSPSAAQFPSLARALSDDGATTPTHSRPTSPIDPATQDAPLSAMLEGPLDPSGGKVTRALKTHIDAVLAAQEDIGRAHLALEGIGTCLDSNAKGKDAKPEQTAEEQLAARAKGVEDIMTKLSELATSLKTYHDIGTPALVFPPGSGSRGMSGMGPMSPSRADSTMSQGAHRTRAAVVTIATPEVAQGSMVENTPVPTPSPGQESPAPAPSTPQAAPSPRTAGRRPGGVPLWLTTTPMPDSSPSSSPSGTPAQRMFQSPLEMTPGSAGGAERRRPWEGVGA